MPRMKRRGESHVEKALVFIRYLATYKLATYVLVVMTMIHLSNQYDRYVLSVAKIPFIDYDSYDFALIAGPFFSVSNSIAGVVISFIGDARPVRLLCVACLVWSTSTGSIAFSRRFWQVALARVGQAISDATCNSFATTILREHFGPAVIGSAVGVYFSGLYAGFSLSLASGNFFEEKLGWKWAYLVAGVGGIVISVVAYLTVPEPPSLSGTADPRSSPAEQGLRARGGQVSSLATAPGAAANPGRHAATRRSVTSDDANGLQRDSTMSPLIANRPGYWANLRYCGEDAKASSGRHDSGEKVDGHESRDAVEADENSREENGEASDRAEGQRDPSERMPLRSERSSFRRRSYDTSSGWDASRDMDGNPCRRWWWPLEPSPTIRAKLSALSSVWLSSPSLLLVCLAGGMRDAGGYVFGYYLATYFSPLFDSDDSLTSDAPCSFSFNHDFHGDQVCNEDYPWCVDGSCNKVTSSPWHNIGMSNTDLAWFVSWVPLVGGSMGAMMGGFISDRFAEVYGTSGRLWVTTVSNALASPLSAGVLLAPYPWCFFCLFGSQLIGEMWIGVVITVVMELVPRHVRVTSVALYNFVITNLSGLATTLVPLLAYWFDACHVFEIMAAPLAGENGGGGPRVSFLELDNGCRGSSPVYEEHGPASDGLAVTDREDTVLPEESIPFHVSAKGSHGLLVAMLILYPGFYLVSSVLCMVAALVLRRDKERLEEASASSSTRGRARDEDGEDDGVEETSPNGDPGRDETDAPSMGDRRLLESGASAGIGQDPGSDLRGAGVPPPDATRFMPDPR